MNSSMTPSQFKKLRDYFWIRSLFVGLPVLDNYDSVEDWKSLDTKVEAYLAMYNEADDDEYEENLEWLREPMRADQKERLRQDIFEALTMLKDQWESEDGALSGSRIHSLIKNGMSSFIANEEIIQWQHNIKFYVFDAIHKYEKALDILDSNQTIINASLPKPQSDKQSRRTDYSTYKSFEKIFFNPDELEVCLDALRNFNPDKPILGEGLIWKGGKNCRGVIVAWIERMETMKKPKIKYVEDRVLLIKLLNAFFIKLNIGEKTTLFSRPVDPKIVDAMASLLPK